ncbi:MAG: hypothetical protein ACRYF4_03400 [Janthinobacterium lividum]
MATITTLPVSSRTKRLARLGNEPAEVWGCTVLALCLLGYHPAAEDGGIYSAALAARLHPSLFPAEDGFAVAHTALGLFVPLLAVLVRTLHLSLNAVLLLAYIATVALTVAGAQRVLQALYPQAAVQRASLLLFAAALGMPIAGTSLYLADPYLTARSFSTPLLLFGSAFLLRDRWKACAWCLLVALLFHPMMTAWAAPVLGALLTLRSRKPIRNTALLGTAIFGTMALVQWFGPVDAPAMRAASLSRDYWFPSQWAWYELLGLFAPPALLLLLANMPASDWLTERAKQLATATAVGTLTTAAAACCFLHMSNRSLLLARLQPLRLLHFVYCIFLLLGGGALASLPWRPLRWITTGVAAISLLLMQRQLYGSSGHFEWPGQTPRNNYQQAFLWIRDNTPVDALFALDADYTRSPGEDAQLFRAIALRSSLPDAAKDGGIASVMPSLAPEWARVSAAQRALASLTDAERLAHLQPFGATWIVLPATSQTGFACPYRNPAVQVCRLR